MNEKTDSANQTSYTAGIFNAITQTLAITSYYYFDVAWPMYFVMGMIALLAFIQTFAGAGVLSNLVDWDEAKSNMKPGETFHILIGFIYCASAYQIYLMGFVFFSGFAFAHAFFYTMMVIFKRLKT